MLGRIKRPRAWNFKDNTGLIYGRLKVLYEDNKFYRWGIKWICLCTCGKICSILGQNLYKGVSTSCGCYHLERLHLRPLKHGMSNTPEYHTWIMMKQRCYNRHVERYPNYGGRGITVCNRWRTSFENFLDDMGKKPNKEYSIDRIDNNKGYTPSNCRWADSITQMNNTSRNKKDK